MYAIALIRYRLPLDSVLVHVDAHRAYLRMLYERGTLISSGPLDPRTGGILLLHVPDEGAAAALDAIRDADPFVIEKVAQYELLPWLPNIGKESLDSIVRR